MIQISEITLSIDLEKLCSGIKSQAGVRIKHKWQYHIHTTSAYIKYSKCSSYNTYYNNNKISNYKVYNVEVRVFNIKNEQCMSQITDYLIGFRQK